ncbi:MAG: thioredoxin [Planctomycetota bacterium]
MVAVLEVTAANFQSVVEGSLSRPVLIDFWASWCAPCRTLGPVLEKIADEFGGAFTLAKVDTEAQPDLAHAFGVQGIPFCVLIDGGRPTDAFQGALPEAEVRRFLERNGVTPLAPSRPEPEPDGPAARIERARRAAAVGKVEEVRAELAGIPEEDPLESEAGRLRDGLAFLTEPLSRGAAGPEGALAEARERFLAGDLDAAMEAILEAVSADKTFRSGLPRKAMLFCFSVIGEEDERCDPYRRRLATLLF